MTRFRSLGIETRTREHPPVFTVDEARALRGQIPGGHCKNLFLKDEKGSTAIEYAMIAGFIVLAIVGIYGIISYMVVRRRNEIGVRIALGADKVNILGMILGEALSLIVIGLVVGTGLAAAAANAARAMLFGLQPFDPLTLVLAAGGLTLIAVAASTIPAVRAVAVDPMQVLREE